MTELVCIVCPKGCRLHVGEKNGYKVTDNSYPRGEVHGKREPIAPTRTATSTAKIRGASTARMPVKTDHEVSKKGIFAVTRLLDGITLQTPVHVDDIAVPNLLGPGVNFVVTRNLARVSDTG